MEKEKKNLGWSICGYVVLIIYLIGLIYFMFFSDFYGRTQISEEYHYNLRPFREIERFIKYHNNIGHFRVFLNLAGNVIGFLPFGFLIPALFKRLRRGWVAALLSLEFSLLIEGIQLVSKVGCFDVDDIILNTLGGFLGYLLFCLIGHVWRRSHG